MGQEGGEAKIVSGWPPGVATFSGPFFLPGGSMSVRFVQASESEHLAAEPRSRRRSLPPSLSVSVSQSVNQRWRERPRCPASPVTPGRRDGVVHAIVGRAAGRCLRAQVVHDERAARCARVRVQFRRDEAADESHKKWARARPNVSRKERRLLRIQIPLPTIAHFRLAPCSASSLLFASLRPGRRPGLRALTTPARGTTWAIARWSAF